MYFAAKFAKIFAITLAIFTIFMLLIDIIEQLRKFEENLKDWQKVYLQKKTERYRLDLTYSSNHELDPEAAVLISADQIDDPHFTDSQKEAYEVYKEDTEESVGSIEDYQKYKDSK